MERVFLVEIQDEDVNDPKNLEEKISDVLQYELGLTLELNLSIQEIK